MIAEAEEEPATTNAVLMPRSHTQVTRCEVHGGTLRTDVFQRPLEGVPSRGPRARTPRESGPKMIAEAEEEPATTNAALMPQPNEFTRNAWERRTAPSDKRAPPFHTEQAKKVKLGMRATRDASLKMKLEMGLNLEDDAEREDSSRSRGGAGDRCSIDRCCML